MSQRDATTLPARLRAFRERVGVSDDHHVTAAALREYADALDKDRGHDRSSVTRLMRKAADELEWLTAARDALQEVGEGFVAAGQAAVARAVAAEAETARLREALRFEGVCEFCSGGGEDHRKWPAAVTACPVCGGDGLSEVAREALAGGADGLVARSPETGETRGGGA